MGQGYRPRFFLLWQVTDVSREMDVGDGKELTMYNLLCMCVCVIASKLVLPACRFYLYLTGNLLNGEGGSFSTTEPPFLHHYLGNKRGKDKLIHLLPILSFCFMDQKFLHTIKMPRFKKQESQENNLNILT